MYIYVELTDTILDFVDFVQQKKTVNVYVIVLVFEFMKMSPVGMWLSEESIMALGGNRHLWRLAYASTGNIPP